MPFSKVAHHHLLGERSKHLAIITPGPEIIFCNLEVVRTLHLTSSADYPKIYSLYI